MIDIFDIPDDLKRSYNRVILRAPEKLRPDDHFQQLTLLHLKVGGERLARHNTELFKLVLEEEKIFNRGLKPAHDSTQSDQTENETEDEDESDDVEEEGDDDSSNSDLSDASELQAGPYGADLYTAIHPIVG